MTTSIMTVPTTFTNSGLPKLEKDPSLTTGVLGLWDALSTDSWPSQAAPTSGVHTWTNLGRSGSALDADIPTADTFAGGFVRPGVVTNGINLNAPDLSTGSPNVLISAWRKVPAVPATFTPMIGRGDATSATANNQFIVSLDGTGKPRLDVMTLDADGTTMRVGALTGANTITVGVHQFGFAITFAANVATYTLYLDGVAIGSSTMSGSKLNPSAYSIALGDRRVGNGGGSATAGYVDYRAHLENLTMSTRNPATVVNTGYTNNAGRFS